MKNQFKGFNLVFFALFLISLVLFFYVLLMQNQENCPQCPECPDCVMDCSLCPEKIKTETETIEKISYVCSDGKVVDDEAECFIEEESDIDFQPILTNEEGTSIVEAIVQPACLKGKNGGWVYFKTDVLPEDVSFEVKESVDGEYKEVYKTNGLFDKHAYFEICNTCSKDADFNLAKDSVYLFRIRFNMTVLNKIYYSNEHIIDTREDSDYMTKKCY